ncbi:hypothetical protein [Streptomyces caeruleatus]|uniref:Uncharacterized protein n=1 Tax=Streptomyces caeruleatus TaxID=661399 RepID=A0A101TWR3_9ACTN|nr:hypothetical protein [Streptomyces caeruleatus]KUO00070.1 hypothetical protein AQJ67_24735 [Streptomyces caeruleatus]
MPQNNSASLPSANLRDDIHAVAPTAALVRIFPEYRAVTHIFEDDFYRVCASREIEREVTRMIRQKFGHTADWRRAHDFFLPTGTLYLTPEPNRIGFVPEDDLSFGLAPARLIAICDGSN